MLQQQQQQKRSLRDKNIHMINNCIISICRAAEVEDNTINLLLKVTMHSVSSARRHFLAGFLYYSMQLQLGKFPKCNLGPLTALLPYFIMPNTSGERKKKIKSQNQHSIITLSTIIKQNTYTKWPKANKTIFKFSP